MVKVLFFGFPAHGHTNPTLALVRELVDRGERVIYYSYDEFQDKIEATGAEFRNYGGSVSQHSHVNPGNLPKLFRLVMEACQLMLCRIYPEVIKESPDLIIHDSFCCWGKYAAASLCVPAVSSVTIFAVSKQSLRFSKDTLARVMPFIFGLNDLRKGLAVQKRIAKEYHIQKSGLIDTFINKENLNIIYPSKAFQPNGDLFDESFKFVGPSIAPRLENTETLVPESNTLPVIYISLGTVVNQNTDFYTTCFQAFSDMQALVILSVGTKTDIASLQAIPDNFIVKNYVPQLDVLSKADCFITHGGMNSVHEGLYYGVPLIVVPQTQEQRDVATRVEAISTGIYLRSITPPSLKAAVSEVLRNSAYKTNAIKLSDSFNEAGGYTKAADEIMHYVKQVATLN